MSHRPRLALLVLFLGIVLTPACDFDGPGFPAIEGSFDRTLSVSGPLDLAVQTGAGSIRVNAGEPGTVRIHGAIRARPGWLGGSERDAEERVRRLEKDPPIEQTGNSLRIGRISDSDLRRNVSISYELIVPPETRARSATGSGSQSIDGVRGPVNASTGSGGITIATIGDEVRATTGSGSIKLDAIKGNVHATTGSGGIRGTGIAGAITARTGSGNIKFEQTAAGNVDVETGSGGIDLAGVRGSVRAHSASGSITLEGEPTGPWTVQASSGGLTLHLRPQTAFDLHARTGSGSISIDHTLIPEGAVTRKEMRGKVRGGGHLLDLRTASGNIRVH